MTSSVLVEDLYRGIFKKKVSQRRLVLLSRFAVLAVAIVAALLAIPRSNTILELVAFAWAGFGAAFGPIIVLSLWWKRLTKEGAIAGLLTGAVVVAVWGFTPVLSSLIYEMIPGFCANMLVAVIVSYLTKPPSEQVVAEFEKAVKDSRE